MELIKFLFYLKKSAMFSFKIFILFTFFMLLFSCTTMTPAAYIQHFEKNRAKMARTVERNGVVSKVAYVPAEYYAARDMEMDPKLSLEDALKRYEMSLYFVLLLKCGTAANQSVLLQKGGVAGFRENVLDNTFRKGQDIFLLAGTDTVKVAQYHYDRNWGIGNGDSFIIVFQKKQIQENVKKYHLILRNFVPELGTIDIPLPLLIKSVYKLKGY